MADNTTTQEYPIDFDLGANGGHVRLRDVQEIEQWISRERDFWKWLQEENIPSKFIFLRNYLFNEFEQASAIVHEATKTAKGEVRNRSVAFLMKYRQGHLLHSTSPEAHFVTELKQTGIVEALTALQMLLGNPTADFKVPAMADLRTWHGILSLILFREGISKNAVTANRDVLKELAQEYSNRLSDDSAASDMLKGRLDELVTEHQTIRDQGRQDLTQIIELARAQTDEHKKEAQRDLDEFKSVYFANLTLRGPVDFWKKKSEKHRRSMERLFWAFGIYVAALAAAASYLLLGTRLGDPSFWKDAGLELVAVMFAGLGIVVAGARTLYKLATSQLHLYNDADERVTMVQVYLALLEGKHAEESHMTIVLQRLFTPASDGVVKDDFIVTWPEAVQAALKK